MSDKREMKVKVLRASDLNQSYKSARLYRILTSSEGSEIEGGHDGMVERMLEAFKASPKYNRAFEFTEIEKTGKKVGRQIITHYVGAAEFSCTPRQTHREYRMSVEVPDEYKGNGRKKEIFEKHLIPHAKEVARMRRSQIRVDVVCKPDQSELINFLLELGFLLRTPWDRRKKPTKDAILVYSKIISHEDGE